MASLNFYHQFFPVIRQGNTYPPLVDIHLLHTCIFITAWIGLDLSFHQNFKMSLSSITKCFLSKMFQTQCWQGKCLTMQALVMTGLVTGVVRLGNPVTLVHERSSQILLTSVIPTVYQHGCPHRHHLSLSPLGPFRRGWRTLWFPPLSLPLW